MYTCICISRIDFASVYLIFRFELFWRYIILFIFILLLQFCFQLCYMLHKAIECLQDEKLRLFSIKIVLISFLVFG